MALLMTTMTAAAQDVPEYLLEVGAGAGLTAYEGDLNGNILKGMKPMGGIVAKYKPNPHTAWAGELSYNQLSGEVKNANTWYQLPEGYPPKFSTTLINFDVKFEYNFWAFGTGREYRGARPLTPFFAFGLGFGVASGDGSVLALQMPVGLGVKYKVAPRLNVTAQWMMHFSGSDKLDALQDPYGIKSNGLFKNTDCYSSLQVMVTYELWAKCKTCHNDSD